MSRPSIEELIEDLRGSTHEEMEEFLEQLLTAKTKDDKLEVIGTAVIDGRTETWESALRFATILEAVIYGEES